MKTTHRIAAATLLLFNNRNSAPTVSVAPTANASQTIGVDPGYVAGEWSSGTPVFDRWESSADGSVWTDITGTPEDPGTMPDFDSPPTDAEFGKVLRVVEVNGSTEAASAATGAVGYASYEAQLLARMATGLIAYWPLDELSGTNADNAQGAARDGTYSGVALDNADGAGATMGRAGLWDGVNDLCNIYTVSLRDAFNGAEGTLSIWAKISASGVWTDGTEDRIVTLTADGNNSIALRNTSGSNTLNALYAAGGTFEQISVGSQTSTGWMHLAITWSKADDQVKFYINGAQAGSTATTLGTFAGTLNAATTVIGASVTTPLLVWSGNLQHAAIWTTPLTLAQIQELAEAF
jgi:hypothetical protein